VSWETSLHVSAVASGRMRFGGISLGAHRIWARQAERERRGRVLRFDLKHASTIIIITLMTIVLDDIAVTARLRPASAVAAMRSALLGAHRGELVAPPRVHADILTFTAGRLPGRWYGYRSYDTHVGGQQVVAVHSEPAGELVGIAVGSALGAYRTGALGAAAADALANPGATTVGVVGAGRQAWTQLWALSAVRPLTDVAVYSPTPQRRAALASRVQADLGIPSRAAQSAREAVTARDIVVLATSSATPVLVADWLSPGTAVTTVGPKQVGRAEFPPDLPDRAQLIVTDSLPQLRAYDPPALLASSAVISLGRCWRTSILAAPGPTPSPCTPPSAWPAPNRTSSPTCSACRNDDTGMARPRLPWLRQAVAPPGAVDCSRKDGEETASNRRPQAGPPANLRIHYFRLNQRGRYSSFAEGSSELSS
jgi:ornithine cyclodeaminase/alanine dehydrogenase-like protein (mu-crystallin family)